MVWTLGAAGAAECGADKLGTSRVMGVGVSGGLEVGLKTYPRTLALADHEVILTFDDGPAAGTTVRILDALAGECVRATFFLIGRHAQAMPQLVQREEREGHTIGHHTFSHPAATLRSMRFEAARDDILRGIAADEAALLERSVAPGGTPDLAAAQHPRTPFFRFPGFADTPDLRKWFGENNVGIFGVDLWASDWAKMTPDDELKLILSRLEKARKGMLLFHDNKPWTAEMLPRFLVELKRRGYHVVQIEPGPGRGPTEPAPAGWRSQTERTLNAVKPRLEHEAATAAHKNAAFAVQPAPQE